MPENDPSDAWGRFSHGARALAALEFALKREVSTERHIHREGEPAEPAPHWTSGVFKLDRMTGGGFYGVSVIAAEGKLGKTMLSLASALEAAATMDWRVVYFNAELDQSDVDTRIDTYVKAHPHCEDARGMFYAYNVGRGVTPEELAACVHMEPSEERVLVVLDSINTISNLSNRPYLEALKEFSLWAMMARRMSRGSCSFQIVAETNKAGGIKGEQLQFWADLVLRLKGGRDNGYVDLEVTHSRRTESGVLGRFLRHVPSASFVQESEIEALRVLQGGAA